MAIVIDVFNDRDDALVHYGLLDGDLFRTQTGNVNEEHGFTRVRMHEADFRELVKERGKRLRINVLSGRYDYLGPQ